MAGCRDVDKAVHEKCPDASTNVDNGKGEGGGRCRAARIVVGPALELDVVTTGKHADIEGTGSRKTRCGTASTDHELAVTSRTIDVTIQRVTAAPSEASYWPFVLDACSVASICLSRSSASAESLA